MKAPPRLAAVALVGATVLAAEVKPTDFYREGPGARAPAGPLDREERHRFALHAKSANFAALDTNRDGVISEAEITAFVKKTRDDAEKEARRLEAELDRHHAETPERIAETMNRLPVRPPPAALFGQWRVRKDLETPTALGEAETAPFAQAKAAEVGISLDRVKPTRQWFARGAVFRQFGPEPRDPKDTTAPTPVADWGAMAGVTFDLRQTRYPGAPAKKGATDTDNVAAKVLFETERLHFDPAARTAGAWSDYWRGGPFFATDSRLASRQAGGELNWQPLFNLPLIGNAGTPGQIRGTAFEIRTRQWWHLESGYVIAPGDKPGLTANTWFFRSGPVLGLELKRTAGWLKGGLAAVSFQHLDGTGTGLKSANFLETSLSLPADLDGHLRFGLTYRKGQQPIGGATWSDTLDFTTGIKF